MANKTNKTKKFKRQKVINIMAPQRSNYFESPEAIFLFNPMPGETVLGCLVRRSKLLTSASVDDNSLIDLINYVTSISDLNSKQKESLRLQCIVLRETYAVAVQKMNMKTWKQCCEQAIDEVANFTGRKTIKSKKQSTNDSSFS